MYLLILFPILMLTTVAGVLSLMFDHPDNVMNNHEPYSQIDESYEMEMRRVAYLEAAS